MLSSLIKRIYNIRVIKLNKELKFKLTIVKRISETHQAFTE
jgi:hypothetical protein